ncbi:ribosomal RNA processing protein 36 homolog isoform X1 [Nematostella vectensis]|uniref:ribosomal RNA processing protein 36 homolog isoform X1 n=1 Tax=Nematostella vectensis TaxID=45351 RepID=UPI002077976B|nr:ribosomal RNA processing protein 36 homolog isoform X1 [Nematostella vectensis]
MDNQLSDSSDDESPTDDCSDEGEVEHLKDELSQIPFCELQDLKDKIGSKKYNLAIHGIMEERTQGIPDLETKKKKNKGPQELSSKQRVPKLRKVVQVKKKMGRDPRFDDLSGKFNEDLFRKSYSFVNDIRVEEKKSVEKELKKTKNAEKRKNLHDLLKVMNQQERSRKSAEAKRESKKKIKETERELVQKGKKPFYLRKSELKKLELAEKYKELKSKGKLQKYLTKRRKKTASKDRRHVPERRQVDQ